MQNTLIDAGPLIALFDRDDRYHEKVKTFLQAYEGRLTTTWPVVTEVMYMLGFSHEAQIDFLHWIKRKGVTLFPLSTEHIERLTQLIRKYADLPMDLADGSLLIAAESLQTTTIATIDSDYRVYRPGNRGVFENLLQEYLL